MRLNLSDFKQNSTIARLYISAVYATGQLACARLSDSIVGTY